MAAKKPYADAILNVGARKPKLKIDPEAYLGLAEFFAIWWAVIALDPSKHRSTRAHLASLGLIEKAGKLALTPRGKAVLDHAKSRYQ